MEDAGPTIFQLVSQRGIESPDDVALLAPGRASTTYGVLSAHLQSIAAWLRAHDVHRADRVALVVESGPEAASAFLGIVSAAVCVPLNPSYRAAELDFFVRDAGVRALVVSSAVDTPARDVAHRLGVDVLELIPDPHRPAGVFGFQSAVGGVDVELADTAAEALVLHTSGTTARPKIVPLAHVHLMASATNVCRTLELRADDRCLNVMPLFHIHGLVASLLASLRAGGSVACAPGFHQLRFFDWIREFEPTWTTAVPTMYQALLERVRREPALLAGHKLRFLRSSSAALPVPVLEGLEETFGVPVVEAYGMTEAAHQMTSNPLPPGVRKPGSVGLSAGPEIAILDADGHRLPGGQVGEVAIHGTNVFDGYEANAEANAAAFAGEWFRTGDEGRLDDDRYLVLLGRLKEIINRAGEKVSPSEIDEVLLRHPAVAEAATFGIPDERLGEEVAAAVVAREGETIDIRELQDFAAQTVAPFKVPRRIVVIDELPKGPTGKLQRVSLPDRLDLTPVPGFTRPGTSAFLEESLRAIWAEVLGLPEVGPDGDFFALGGDSILGAEAVARVRDLLGKPELPLVAIVRAPTPRTMAGEIESELGWVGDGVLTIREEANAALPPIFAVHGVDGDGIRFAAISRMLTPSRSVYGLRAPARSSGDELTYEIPNLSARYLEAMRSVQPTGPYVVASYCMGAGIALDIASRLEAEAESTALVLIDPRLRRPTGLRYALWLFPRRVEQRRLTAAIRRRLRRRSVPEPDHLDNATVWYALEAAREAYLPAPTSTPAALLKSRDFARFEMPDWYLRRVFRHVVVEENVPSEHVNLFQQPNIVALSLAIGRALSLLAGSED